MHESPLPQSVRRAKRSDIPALLAIEQSTFVEADGKLSRRAFRYHIASPNLLLVSTSGPDSALISGYILVFIRKKSARIYSLATAIEHRQSGVAKALLSACLESVSELGIAEVKLELRASNTVARSLYQSFGFEAKKTRQGYYGDGETALIMSKNVEAPLTLPN